MIFPSPPPGARPPSTAALSRSLTLSARPWSRHQRSATHGGLHRLAVPFGWVRGGGRRPGGRSLLPLPRRTGHGLPGRAASSAPRPPAGRSSRRPGPDRGGPHDPAAGPHAAFRHLAPAHAGATGDLEGTPWKTVRAAPLSAPAPLYEMHPSHGTSPPIDPVERRLGRRSRKCIGHIAHQPSHGPHQLATVSDRPYDPHRRTSPGRTASAESAGAAARPEPGPTELGVIGRLPRRGAP